MMRLYAVDKFEIPDMIVLVQDPQHPWVAIFTVGRVDHALVVTIATK